MVAELLKQTKDTTGVKVKTIPGGEPALAAGGIHCNIHELYGIQQ
jgi:hypothetical protein